MRGAVFPNFLCKIFQKDGLNGTFVTRPILLKNTNFTNF